MEGVLGARRSARTNACRPFTGWEQKRLRREDRETMTTVAKKINTPARQAHNRPGPACPGAAEKTAANSRKIRLSKPTTISGCSVQTCPFIWVRFENLPVIFWKQLRGLRQFPIDSSSDAAQL